MIDLNNAPVLEAYVPMDHRHVRAPNRNVCIACGCTEQEICEKRIHECANWQRGLEIMFRFACQPEGRA